jgi:hypothetical protein
MRLPAVATAVIVVVLGGWWAESQWAAPQACVARLTLTRGSYEITARLSARAVSTSFACRKRGVWSKCANALFFDGRRAIHALRAIAGEYWVEAVSRWNRS